MKKESLNVGLTIANEIHSLHSKNKGSLTYARIITQLCLNAGVSSEGLIPMKSSSTIDLAPIFGAPPGTRTSRASSSKAPPTKQSSKAKLDNASSSRNDKVLRHLRVVHENIRRVHEHMKVCVMLEPLLRVVGTELNLPVEKLVPVGPLEPDFIADLMKFEEFSEDEEVMDDSNEDNDA